MRPVPIGLASRDVDSPSPDLDLSAHPNDAFFKSVFSDPEQAAAFFRSHLPPALTAHIDWRTLKVLPGSFVKASLQQVHSDLLFAVLVGGKKCMLYLLFEHQSTPDPAMPLRLLAYMLEILLQHQQDKGLPLPPVLPFVLHQGPDAWNISTAFEDLFSLPEEGAAELLVFLPKFRHALLDLSHFDPSVEEQDARLRMVLQLMKLARQRDLLRFFRWLAGSLVEQVPDNLLARMLLYALHADSELDVEDIYRSLSDNPHLEQRTMSVAEKLKAEGRMEGRVEGRVEGLSKGLWIGRIQLLDEFLGLVPRSRDAMEASTLEELESLHRELHGEYEKRFKGR